MTQKAWIVRMSTGGGDVTEKGRSLGMLLLGWSDARGLDDNELEYYEFRERIHAAYYPDDDNYRRSGRAAGELWKFMRDMKAGDLIVVPRPGAFWVGQVAGSAFESDDGDEDDTVHRRPVTWLEDGDGIERRKARSALVSRMKSYWTVTDASDLIGDIEQALATAHGPVPSSAATLRERLVDEAQKELLGGYFDERRFEELVRDVLIALGAADARIIARQHDVGVDIHAEFPVGGLTLVSVGVQAKYWRPDWGPAGHEPIEQLCAALDEVHIGMVVTTTTFTDAARAYAQERAIELGKEILLFDGSELAQLIIDQGLRDLIT